MSSFLTAVQDETDVLSREWQARAGSGGAGVAALRLDMYREMRRLTLSVILRVTFGLGEAGRQFDAADDLSQTIGSYLEAIVATANEVCGLTTWRALDTRLPPARERTRATCSRTHAWSGEPPLSGAATLVHRTGSLAKLPQGDTSTRGDGGRSPARPPRPPNLPTRPTHPPLPTGGRLSRQVTHPPALADRRLPLAPGDEHTAPQPAPARCFRHPRAAHPRPRPRSVHCVR
jgi:hypothetical protein